MILKKKFEILIQIYLKKYKYSEKMLKSNTFV